MRHVETIIFRPYFAPNYFFWGIYGHFKMAFYTIFQHFYDYFGSFGPNIWAWNAILLGCYDFMVQVESPPPILSIFNDTKMPENGPKMSYF